MVPVSQLFVLVSYNFSVQLAHSELPNENRIKRRRKKKAVKTGENKVKGRTDVNREINEGFKNCTENYTNQQHQGIGTWFSFILRKVLQQVTY